jgi:iron complex transport system substrate-binding protein
MTAKTSRMPPLRATDRSAAMLCAALCCAAVAGCAPRHGTTEISDGPRIVSFLPSGTETLFALGLGDCVVGRSRFCDFPPEAKALPAVGDLFSADEDALAELRPTHAVLGRADAPQAALLRALGCEIVEGRAETAEDVLAFADTLGELFPERTNGLAHAGTAWRAAMEKLSHAEYAESAERVLVVVSHAPGRFGAAFAAGEGTFHDELLRAAGFSNALAGVRGYPSLDPDRIAALAPDLLVDIHPEGDPPDEDAWGYLARTRVETLHDTAALRPGPRLPEVLSRFRALAR